MFALNITVVVVKSLADIVRTRAISTHTVTCTRACDWCVVMSMKADADC
jgi:hypothetical protein